MGCSNARQSLSNTQTVESPRSEWQPEDDFDSFPFFDEDQETCRLLNSLTDDSPLANGMSWPRWAAEPQTKRSCALATLNRKAKSINPNLLTPYAQTMVDGLGASEEAYVQHLTYFLFVIANQRAPQFVDSLVIHGLLESLVVNLTSTVDEFRRCSLNLLRRLLKHSPLAAEALASAGGCYFLSLSILQCRLNVRELDCIMDCLCLFVHHYGAKSPQDCKQRLSEFSRSSVIAKVLQSVKNDLRASTMSKLLKICEFKNNKQTRRSLLS